MAWKDRLAGIVRQQEQSEKKSAGREEVLAFLRDTVAPALEAVRDELTGHGREVDLEVEPEKVAITVDYQDEEEFYYAVRARTYHKASFGLPELAFRGEGGKDVFHRAEVYVREGSQNYGILGYDREQVIANFMHEYDRALRWQKPSRRGG